MSNKRPSATDSMWYRTNRLQENIGWAGMALVQCASFPTLYMLAAGHRVSLPDLSLGLCLMAGLTLYLIRAYLQRDRVYMVSNGLGLAVQSAMLAVIILAPATQ